ncbi:MAG: tRNA-dihydrouridine synthase [Gammaproteobacteria bacterium]|nr:tRNA-dihydrouridine synthase [Gammaproteobacteria bacterium]
MEGLLDCRLRAIIARAGRYDWCVTEFIRVTDTLLPKRCFTRVAPELGHGSRTPDGTPVRVQLLGSDPVCLSDNAARLVDLAPAGIDLNFGCPAPLVNRHGGGAVLLDEPALLNRIVAQVSRAIGGRVPFTAKMRLGVHDNSRALEAAQALTEGGAEMLVVHARTKDEAYRPPAHWEWVARIAEAVHAPVVANGEIWTVDDYLRCRAASGQQDVMLGRGAVADPFLVERIRDRLVERTPRSIAADWPRVLPLLFDYWESVCRDLAPRHASGRIKQWLNLLRRNYPQAETLFQQLRSLRDVAEIDLALHMFGRELMRDDEIAMMGRNAIFPKASREFCLEISV